MESERSPDIKSTEGLIMTDEQMRLFLLKSRVRSRLIRLKSTAIELYPVLKDNKQFNRITIDFEQDLGDAMGQARMSLNLIEIDIPSLIEHTTQVLDEVLGHELCHLMVPILHKGIGYKDDELHGAEWRNIMVRMGIDIDPKDLV